jgi:phosphatidylserine decarboxylase
MIRFWSSPKRKSTASETAIISPADGRIIYIHKINKQEMPFSIKKNKSIQLIELIKTDILNNPCWLVGINMTLFDVHKNCAPITGRIILQKYFRGQFLSLKNNRYLKENERNTFVIENGFTKVGIIQIASRRVRKIDLYVNQGDDVKRGQWLGMIRFGSQVDIIIPANYCIKVNIKDQVFAGKTLIADLHENSD